MARKCKICVYEFIDNILRKGHVLEKLVFTSRKYD